MRPVHFLPVLLAVAPVTAQEVLWDAHGETCTLYEDGAVARPGPALQSELLDQAALRTRSAAVTIVAEGTGSTFEVTYTGFTAEAQAAFQAAVDVWADHLVSPVPIRVEASFGPLGENVLGSAGPRLTANFTGAPQRQTWYPFALADAFAEKDLYPDHADIVATFNSSFQDWYYGTDGNAPSDKFDFVTVVLHELGHGLGFVGSGDVDDGAGDAECEGGGGNGCWGTATGTGAVYPFVFDGLVEAGGGAAFLDETAYPQNSAALGTLLQSGDLFVNAPTVVAVGGDVRARVWAPATFDAGSSFSHWDEIVYTQGTSSSLMTPRISRGEAYQDPGTITCAFFQDMGWALGGGCAALIGAPSDVPPVFSSSPATAAVEGEPYVYTASASDPDGTAVTFSTAALPSWLALVDHGDGTATLSGTPHDGDVGDHAVALVASDGSLSAEQPFTLAVAAVNYAPEAGTDAVGTAEDTPVRVAVLDNDSDPDAGDDLVLKAATQPEHGAVAIGGDGAVTYTPDADFHGEDAFTYTVGDGAGGEATATVTVTVRPVNDAPTASTITVPAAGATLDLSGEANSTVTVVWTAATDVDGDGVSYRWELSTTDAFASLLLSAEEDGTGTAVTYADLVGALDQAGLKGTVTVYHRVITSDGQASTAGPTVPLTVVQGASTSAAALPPTFALLGARPNPTAGRFTVTFDLTETSRVRLDVYDLLGRRVTGLDAGTVSAGGGRLVEADLSSLGPGVYAYRLTATGPTGGQVAAGRATVIR